MSSNPQNLTVDPEIEAAYADIGRSVVEQALKNASGQSEGTIEANVTLRLTLGAGDTGARMPIVCCICTIEGPDSVIICRGPCCPGF